jgi:hypothetical protein
MRAVRVDYIIPLLPKSLQDAMYFQLTFHEKPVTKKRKQNTKKKNEKKEREEEAEG